MSIVRQEQFAVSLLSAYKVGMNEIDHPSGDLWQEDNKYFFAPDEGWWLAAEKKLMHTYDHEKLIREALAKYPTVTYFKANDDRTAFGPDQNYTEWFNDDFLPK